MRRIDDLTRLILITGESITDVVGREVEAMEGDPILRERMRTLLARDCARRKLCAILLPALDAEGRAILASVIGNWSESPVTEAAREIVLHAWESAE